MAIDPDLSRYETDVVLLDGGTVHIRPIRPTDGQKLIDAFARQSPESIYYRFFSPKPRLSEKEVEYFTHIDYVDRFALVAVTGEDGIAVARYDRGGEGHRDEAEVAFFVDEHHRKRGLSTVMLEHLALAAREHGITWFTATVLPDNHKMLRVFRDAGWKVQKHFEDGVIEVVFPIEPTPDSLDAMLARDQWAEARSIERILAPGSVALVGVGPDADSVAGAVLAKLRSAGFAGPIHAVGEGGPEVHPTITDIPDEVDLAVIAVPAPEVLDIARACAAKGVKAMVVLSAGFGESGPAGARRQAELLQVTREAGMRLVGPNCIGVFNTVIGLDATFTPNSPPAGRVAFQSQSGGLGIALIEWSREAGIGLSSFVSVGNKADVSGNDLIQYWAQDDSTDVILLYLESFGNPRKFARLARRVSQVKPMVAVKSGRTTAGTRAANSHTAAPAVSATPDDVVSDLFEQAGIIRVDTLEELLDTAQVLATQPLPHGHRVAIVGNAGGPGILAADACENAGLEVARLTGSTAAHIRAVLGADAAVRNPIDMAAAATAEHYRQVLELVLADDQVDAVIAIYTPPVVSAAAEVAVAVAQAAGGADKPVVANFLASREQPRPLPVVDAGAPDRRVPSFRSPEPAARALGRVARYAAWRRRDPGAVPTLSGIDRAAATALVHAALDEAATDGDGGVSPPVDAGAVEPAPYPAATSSAGEPATDGSSSAGSATDRSPGAGSSAVPEPGATALSGFVRPSAAWAVPAGPEDVDAEHVEAAPIPLAPAAVAAVLGAYGITVVPGAAGQPPPAGSAGGGSIVGPGGGVHAAVGLVQDPSFGPLLVFGLGGLRTELLADRTFRILPLTDTDAHDVVGSLRASPLLLGEEGSAPVRTDLLEDLLLRVSALAEDLAEVAEIDLNPVVVSADGLWIGGADLSVQRFRSGPNDLRRSLD